MDRDCNSLEFVEGTTNVKVLPAVADPLSLLSGFWGLGQFPKTIINNNKYKHMWLR